ncbi:MAG: ATP-binding protein [Methylococcaceae bacterium]|jgi:AAA+ superfamily predicted ATPase
MARADLLVSLISSGSRGDQAAFRKTAEALIAEEREKGHGILAERLSSSITVAKPQQISALNTKQSELFYEITPNRKLSSLLISELSLTQINDLIEEQHRAELLHAYNLSARSRVLLVGSPGNGKTSLAEAIATELMVPFIVIRYETLIGSYLGETANRLKQIIDYAKTQRCVLFLDEFETIGKERGDTHETGEIKRVVSSLLLQLDDLPDYVVVIAASNHPELLDKAVWRRFQFRIELPIPTREQISQFILTMETKTTVKFGFAAETIAKKMLGANFAEIEELCLTIVRRAILNKQTDNTKSITTAILNQWQKRFKPNPNTEGNE